MRLALYLKTLGLVEDFAYCNNVVFICLVRLEFINRRDYYREALSAIENCGCADISLEDLIPLVDSPGILSRHAIV